ncbi:MAG: Uncharacterized protein CEO21_400 [Microgenomates group bacterium Gr01-1014_80]|nr:MAG: Uncharacterized protein CEO21_400 [Microgenomates group bacterium Gr01-1014_80]
MVLLLVMTVALGIGLSIISRTLTDVSTSTKVEQSSRAFSAAEAGIEQALKQNYQPVNFANQSQATVNPPVDLPLAGKGLEYPPVSKEETAHFWLADPKASLPTCGPPNICYTQPTLDIYWGSPNSDKAAIEITIINWNGSSFQQTKYFYDSDPTRISANGFSSPLTPCSSSISVDTSFGSSRQFYCKVTLSGLPSGLMILRARLLYTNVTQPIAVIPTGGASLPPQAKVYTSIGTSGNTQRTIQLFSLEKVVPFYLDYAIFSTGSINK